MRFVAFYEYVSSLLKIESETGTGALTSFKIKKEAKKGSFV